MKFDLEDKEYRDFLRILKEQFKVYVWKIKPSIPAGYIHLKGDVIYSQQERLRGISSLEWALFFPGYNIVCDKIGNIYIEELSKEG